MRPHLTWMPVVVQVNPEDFGGQDGNDLTMPGLPVVNADSTPLIHGKDGEDNTVLLDLVLEEQTNNEANSVLKSPVKPPVTLIWAMHAHSQSLAVDDKAHGLD
ncbi:hypothetical protein C0991_002009 [Blastosporella zonata]|nr:hypothetical protein C0991_002009 [Blastosporella zonata]